MWHHKNRLFSRMCGQTRLPWSFSTQSQMDSLGGLSTLWTSTSLQRPAIWSRRGWKEALQYRWCPKDNSEYSLQSSTATKHQKLLFPALLKCLQFPHTFIYKQKATILVCLHSYNVSSRATYLLSHNFYSLSLYRENISPEIYLNFL